MALHELDWAGQEQIMRCDGLGVRSRRSHETGLYTKVHSAAMTGSTAVRVELCFHARAHSHWCPDGHEPETMTYVLWGTTFFHAT